MTIIELFVFLIMLALGVLVAALCKSIGGIWLAVPGFVTGVLILPSFNLAYDRYRKWAYCGDELMPPCSCGSNDYKVEAVGDGDEMEFHEICQSCGKIYQKHGGNVHLVCNGEKTRYMHLVKHKGWIEWVD